MVTRGGRVLYSFRFYLGGLGRHQLTSFFWNLLIRRYWSHLFLDCPGASFESDHVSRSRTGLRNRDIINQSRAVHGWPVNDSKYCLRNSYQSNGAVSNAAHVVQRGVRDKKKNLMAQSKGIPSLVAQSIDSRKKEGNIMAANKGDESHQKLRCHSSQIEGKSLTRPITEYFADGSTIASSDKLWKALSGHCKTIRRVDIRSC